MILLLDTSTPTARLLLRDGDRTVAAEWQAERQLAKGILAWLELQLKENGWTWTDITGIGAYRGPGSFTGLRIGLAVMNTLAESLGVPIVGANGDIWQETAHKRLTAGENDSIVLPFYDREAIITKQRK